MLLTWKNCSIHAAPPINLFSCQTFLPCPEAIKWTSSPGLTTLQFIFRISNVFSPCRNKVLHFSCTIKARDMLALLELMLATQKENYSCHALWNYLNTSLCLTQLIVTGGVASVNLRESKGISTMFWSWKPFAQIPLHIVRQNDFTVYAPLPHVFQKLDA